MMHRMSTSYIKTKLTDPEFLKRAIANVLKKTMGEIPDYVEDCFENFIDSPDEKVSIKKLPRLFSSLQRPFSKNYIKELLQEEGLESEAAIDIKQFMKIFRVRKCDEADVQMLVDSFKIFDSNQDGKISIDEYNSIVSNYGLPFTSEEYEKIINIIEVENYEFDYTKLSELIISMIAISDDEDEDGEEIADNVLELEVEKVVESGEEEEREDPQHSYVNDDKNDAEEENEEEEFLQQEEEEKNTEIFANENYEEEEDQYNQTLNTQNEDDFVGSDQIDINDISDHDEEEEEEEAGSEANTKKFVGSSDIQKDSQIDGSKVLASSSLVDSNQLLSDQDELDSMDIVLKPKA